MAEDLFSLSLEELQAVKITVATGGQQTLVDAPAVASVITAYDIVKSGASDIDDVLAAIPGLHVSVDPIGYQPVYIFRGIRTQLASQVQILINGIPSKALFQGTFHQLWGGMPVKSIARIEVIRGPSSSVYGADAMSGIINIITKNPQELSGTQIGGGVGSYDTADAWILHGSEWGEWGLGFTLEYHQTEGFDGLIEHDSQTNLDLVFGTSASLAPGEVSLSRQNLDMRLELQRDTFKLRIGLQHRSDWGIGPGLASALDPEVRIDSERWNLDVGYHDLPLGDDWQLTSVLSYYSTTHEKDNNLRLYPRGTNLGFGVLEDGLIANPEMFERHYRFDNSVFFNGFAWHKLRVGMGYGLSDMHEVRETKNFGINPQTGLPHNPADGLIDVTDTPYVFLPEENRENYYVSLQDIWKLADDWEFTAGLRYDYYSDFGDTINPRLALVWHSTEKLVTKLLYGEAFRAPSFAQLYLENTQFNFGNPDLEAETLSSLELAFDYSLNDTTHIRVNLFHYEWDDIIRSVPIPNTTAAQSHNVGKQIGIGFEAELLWQAHDDVRVRANYAYVDAEDDETGEATANVPANQLFVGINWNFISQWSLNAEFHSIMDRKRVAQDSRDDIDDYHLLHLSLQYGTSNQRWFTAISIRNVLDEDAREPSLWAPPVPNLPNDLPLPGRNYRAELSYNF